MEIFPQMYVSQYHQKLNKITLCDVTTRQLYRDFSIGYKFYAAAQIQTIIETESAAFSHTNVA